MSYQKVALLVLIRSTSRPAEPAIFQVFNQAKLVMTAVFAYIILKKDLSKVQWTSIVMLAVGLAVVQLTSQKENITIQSSAAVSTGFILMMIVALFSGFAGVYTELILKKGNDFWATNAQMAGFSLVPATIMMLIECFRVGSFDVFEYFGGWAISTILMNAAGGILVSMVIKYADSIVKGFSLAAAVLCTILVNVVFLGARFSAPCLFGILTVLASVFLYNSSKLTTREKAEPKQSDSPEHSMVEQG